MNRYDLQTFGTYGIVMMSYFDAIRKQLNLYPVNGGLFFEQFDALQKHLTSDRLSINRYHESGLKLFHEVP